MATFDTPKWFAATTSLLLFSLCLNGSALASESRAGQRAPASSVVPEPEHAGTRSATHDARDEAPVAAHEGGYGDHLSGGWGGTRQKLSENGIDLAVIYKLESHRATRKAEGVDSESQNHTLGNLDVRLSFDTEKMGAWKGGSFFFYGLFNDGDNPSEFIGDEQVTSNIDGGDWQGRLYEAWYQQAFADGLASVLVGIHDLNSEFYVTDTSGIFMNSSFGVGRDISQAGTSGPSIFPVTAPALRLRFDPSENFYAQAAVFNGVSGDLNYPTGTHVRWSPKTDGLLYIVEAGYVRTAGPAKEGEGPEVLGKYALGTWGINNGDEVYAAPDEKAPTGTYLLVDHALTASISSFLRYGFTNNKSYNVESNVAAGAVFKGLIPTRDEDLLGVGVTSVAANSDYREANTLEARETVYEITYRANVCRGVVLQPNYQFVDQPGFVRGASGSTLGGRLEINF